MTHAASDATPYSSFLFSIRTIPDPASKKTLKRYSWSRRILRHLHFERKEKKKQHPWEIKPWFLNVFSVSLAAGGKKERNDNDKAFSIFFSFLFYLAVNTRVFHCIQGWVVTHTKISMGYLVAPDKSALGGIRSLTRASNPPGTGTLKRRTTGCDFSAIISATASFASHVSILVEFWKGESHGDCVCVIIDERREANFSRGIKLYWRIFELTFFHLSHFPCVYKLTRKKMWLNTWNFWKYIFNVRVLD